MTTNNFNEILRLLENLKALPPQRLELLAEFSELIAMYPDRVSRLEKTPAWPDLMHDLEGAIACLKGELH